MQTLSLNPFPNKPWFLRVCSTSLLKTLREKEKLLVTSNFSFSHSVFYPFKELSTIFIQFKIIVYKLSVWKSLKFAVWERDKQEMQIVNFNCYFSLTDCPIFFKINRVQAVDDIDKLCKFHKNLTTKCRLYCVNKKCKFST